MRNMEWMLSVNNQKGSKTIRFVMGKSDDFPNELNQQTIDRLNRIAKKVSDTDFKLEFLYEALVPPPSF